MNMNMPRDKGFTLLEMLIYVFVLSLVISVVVSSFLWIVRAQASVAASKEVVESTRAALTILENEIKEAESIYTPTSSSSTPPQVSLETRRNPPLGEDTTYVDFFLCGTRLCMKRESQSAVALTSERVVIQNLTFERVETASSVPSVQVVFDASFNNPRNRPELNITLQIQTTISQRTY
jgi:prepilin-type N-terminal cleavage/methylation domain-containing protein